jgi:hypothetical protein
MIDKNLEVGSTSGGKKKKARTSPVAGDQTHDMKRSVDCIAATAPEAASAQIPTAKPAYLNFASQSQVPLSMQMLKDGQTVPPSNMYQQSHTVQDISTMQQWPYPPPPSREELTRYTGGFAPPMQFSQHRRRATMDYAPSNLTRSAPDSIPYETVRRLLLGHLDPVTLAYNILSPEDAAAVARLHMNNTTTLNASSSTATGSSFKNAQIPQAGQSNPLQLCSIVSDGSSSLSECTVKEEQSSDDSSRQSSVRKPRALPKKKRKFIE